MEIGGICMSLTESGTGKVDDIRARHHHFRTSAPIQISCISRDSSFTVAISMKLFSRYESLKIKTNLINEENYLRNPSNKIGFSYIAPVWLL